MSPTGPSGLSAGERGTIEWERQQRENGDGGGGNVRGRRTCQETAVWQMTDSAGLFAELEEGKMWDWLWDCMKIE